LRDVSPITGRFSAFSTAWFRRGSIAKILGAGCVVGGLMGTAVQAQPTGAVVTLPDLMQGAQQWAQDNLDTNVLAALSQIDPAAVQRFYQDLQARLQGDYVVDLAALRQTARTLLPLLQSREETRPYAAWLQSEMDYLDVAEEIRQAAPPPPPAALTNQPPPMINNPSPQKERALWVAHDTGRPWPAGAKAYVTELKPVFAAQKVPPELVWVAEVESGFDARAESPAVRAVVMAARPALPGGAQRQGLGGLSQIPLHPVPRLASGRGRLQCRGRHGPEAVDPARGRALRRDSRPSTGRDADVCAPGGGGAAGAGRRHLGATAPAAKLSGPGRP